MYMQRSLIIKTAIKLIPRVYLISVLGDHYARLQIGFVRTAPSMYQCTSNYIRFVHNC